jgi:hypothetical protein
VSTNSRKELRDFGLITGTLFVLIFGLLFPSLRHRAFPFWPFLLGIWLAGAGLLAPQTLTYPFQLWTRVGMILGWINSRIVLTCVYLLVIVPTGLIVRLLGRDPMAQKFDPTVDTYRVTSRLLSRETLDRTF